MKFFSYLLFFLFLPLGAQSFHTVTAYEEAGGKLMVRATVNGVAGRFLLDTGAPCCVTDAFAERARIGKGYASQAEDSNGASVATSIVQLDSLRLGRVTFSSLGAMRLEAGSVLERMGVDGIVGYNLFAMGAIRFDGAAREFVFTSDIARLDVSRAHSTPLLPQSYVPLIAVRLGEQTDTAMFDSGAAEFYELSSRSFARLGGQRSEAWTHWGTARGVLSIGAAGIEQASVKHRVAIPRFALCDATFKNVPTITTDAPDSRLGSELLRYGDVVIDYRGRTFYYLPRTTQSPDLSIEDWDVVITVEDDSLTAGIVWDEQLPIRSGDRILAVNGQRFGKVDMHTATTQGILSMPGNRAALTFFNRRTNREQTVTIRKTKP